MKTYIEVTRKIEHQIYCDVCGDCCTKEYESEYATLEALWGYFSKKDGDRFDIQLCEKCFDEIIDWMKQKRKIHLEPFNYPYDKDPLKGQKTLRD